MLTNNNYGWMFCDDKPGCEFARALVSQLVSDAVIRHQASMSSDAVFDSPTDKRVSYCPAPERRDRFNDYWLRHYWG